MRLEELFAEEDAPLYTRKINIYFGSDLQADEVKAKEIAGMLRGLANAINGFASVGGLYNDLFLEEERVTFRFRDDEQASRFKTCIYAYFAKQVLDDLAAKRVLAKSTRKPIAKKAAAKPKQGAAKKSAVTTAGAKTKSQR